MASFPRLVALSLCCAWLAGGCCGFATDNQGASADMRKIVEEPVETTYEEPVPAARKKAVRKKASRLKQKSVGECRRGTVTLYRLADGTFRSPDWGGLSRTQRRACIREAFYSR